jgi:hypothetical protein
VSALSFDLDVKDAAAITAVREAARRISLALGAHEETAEGLRSL